MKLEEALQRTLSLYSRGVQTDDSRLTPRHVYSVLKTLRSMVLRQQHTAKQLANQWAYQTLPCIELIKVTENGCSMLRSKHPIPAIMSGLDKHLVQSVTTIDGSVRLSETTYETSKYSKGNKYTGTMPLYFFKNKYLYITQYEMLQGISMSGIFDDPLEALIFPSAAQCGECKECDCVDIMSWEFPIDNNTFESVNALQKNELIVLFAQMMQDRTNDASDDAQSQGKMIHQPS